MEEFVYEDDDTLHAEKVSRAYSVLVHLGELGLFTPKLREANVQAYDDAYAVIDALKDSEEKHDLRSTFMQIKAANHSPPLPDVSDEVYQSGCDDGSIPSVNGDNGPLRLAVRDQYNTLVCKSYCLRTLAQHIANEGWSEPSTHRPFQEFHIQRIKAAFAAVHHCFTYEDPHVIPVHTFGTVTVMCDVTIKRGTVGVSIEIYEEMLRSDITPLVLQVAGPNSAVFCTPEPAGHSTAVQLSLHDYDALGHHDDDYELLMVYLPVAKSVMLSDPTVELDLFMEAFDASGSTLLRVGDTYNVMGVDVSVMSMRPTCATARPAVGSTLELDVDLIHDEEIKEEKVVPKVEEEEKEETCGHGEQPQTEAAKAFLERRKRFKS